MPIHTTTIWKDGDLTLLYIDNTDLTMIKAATLS